MALKRKFNSDESEYPGLTEEQIQKINRHKVFEQYSKYDKTHLPFSERNKVFDDFEAAIAEFSQFHNSYNPSNQQSIKTSAGKIMKDWKDRIDQTTNLEKKQMMQEAQIDVLHFYIDAHKQLKTEREREPKQKKQINNIIAAVIKDPVAIMKEDDKKNARPVGYINPQFMEYEPKLNAYYLESHDLLPRMGAFAERYLIGTNSTLASRHYRPMERFSPFYHYLSPDSHQPSKYVTFDTHKPRERIRNPDSYKMEMTLREEFQLRNQLSYAINQRIVDNTQHDIDRLIESALITSYHNHLDKAWSNEAKAYTSKLDSEFLRENGLSKKELPYPMLNGPPPKLTHAQANNVLLEYNQWIDNNNMNPRTPPDRIYDDENALHLNSGVYP